MTDCRRSDLPAGAPAVSRRRRALTLGTLAASAGVGAALPGLAQGSLRTLKMVAQNPFQLADYPALIADRTGAFARRGIKAEFTSVTNSTVALFSGDIDITTVGSANGLLPMARKQDFQFISVCVERLVLALMVKPDSPVVKVAHRWPDVFQELRGKRVGVTVPGALVDQMGRWMAAKAGMTPDKDIIIHPAGDAMLLTANLEKGTYEAALQLSPLFELMTQRKIAVSVLDVYKGEGPAELATFPFACPATRKTFADKNPELMNGFVAAMQEAVDYARNPANKTALTEMVAREVKQDPKALEPAIGTFVSALGNTVKMSRTQWATALSVGKINGVIKEDIPFEDAVFAGARA